MKPATSIEKVCRVLNEFRDRPYMGVTDLARRTDLLPSDIHRILVSLKSFGFVEQNSETKTYRLGVALLKLGLTVFQRNELSGAARPLLLRLSQELESTAHLAIFDRKELDIFLAEQIDYSKEVPFKAKFGAPAGAHCTALGKAIMADLDADTISLYLQKHGMKKSTHHTITHMAEFRAALAQTQAQGYGLDLEEYAEGACCLGASIRDWTGNTVGAISISMVAHRFYSLPERNIAAMVKATAAQVSLEIGFRPHVVDRTLLAHS